VLFQWLDEKPGTFLIEHKLGYLNLGGLLVRFVIYAAASGSSWPARSSR
jgi:hypothetical protein